MLGSIPPHLSTTHFLKNLFLINSLECSPPISQAYYYYYDLYQSN